MKIDFKLKKNFTKESFTVNPHIYFRFVIFIAIGITLVGFGLGFSVFKKFDKVSSEQANETTEKAELNRKERIENILQYFVEREKKSIEIINSPAPIVDPSI